MGNHRQAQAHSAQYAVSVNDCDVASDVQPRIALPIEVCNISIGGRFRMFRGVDLS